MPLGTNKVTLLNILIVDIFITEDPRGHYVYEEAEQNISDFAEKLLVVYFRCCHYSNVVSVN
jgi:hypothetical protein